jgi:hypothetical protein
VPAMGGLSAKLKVAPTTRTVTAKSIFFTSFSLWFGGGNLSVNQCFVYTTARWAGLRDCQSRDPATRNFCAWRDTIREWATLLPS